MEAIDYFAVTKALGGNLVSLVPKRAPEAGQPSPGMILTIEIEGNRIALDDFMSRAVARLANA